jgi:hypothetical protein
MAGQPKVAQTNFKAIKEAILNSAHKVPIIYPINEEA